MFLAWWIWRSTVPRVDINQQKFLWHNNFGKKRSLKRKGMAAIPKISLPTVAKRSPCWKWRKIKHKMNNKCFFLWKDEKLLKIVMLIVFQPYSQSLMLFWYFNKMLFTWAVLCTKQAKSRYKNMCRNGCNRAVKIK